MSILRTHAACQGQNPPRRRERGLNQGGPGTIFIDGIEIARRSVLVALGVTIDGTKVPLGIWAGSTGNHVIAPALLQNLIAPGLRVETSMLFVIDGGKGLRKAPERRVR